MMKQWYESLALRHALVGFGIGATLAILGPYGSSGTLTPLERGLFWIGLSLFGYLCALTVHLAVRVIPTLARRGRFILFLIVATGSSIPECFAAAWAISLVQDGRIITPSSLPGLYMAVLAIQGILTIAIFQVPESSRRTLPIQNAEKYQSSASDPQQSRFPDWLPDKLERTLIAVSAEDHYLRIHTGTGSDLIHMRMVDALKDLAGMDGLQVHRSWWVARHAVTSLRRDGAQTWLALTGGIEAPVSRTYLMAVRAETWPNANQ